MDRADFMQLQLVHQFPKLFTGKLLKRYKRFFAEIELDRGEVITAHCPNTGAMSGVCEVGSPVAVSYQPSPKRKLAYTWELINVHHTWVGINTALPNSILGGMLRANVFPEFAGYLTIRSEVLYGQEGSRIDFLLENSQSARVYLEVKNTTWTKGTVAIFPDTETTRGQKHLRELMSVLAPSTRAVIVYFIYRGDCDRFRGGDEADPRYGALLREAIKKGLEVLPCRFQVDLTGVYYLGLAEFISVQD